MGQERIQKVLARAGYGSRRNCETLIVEGRVRVDNQVATLGQKVDSTSQILTVDGVRVRIPEVLTYVALNKPRGVLSDTEDERGRKTVLDLVPHEGHLFAIGRLDINSEGLVLLTNDGDLANRILHPRYGHEREYRVRIEGHPSAETLKTWERGVVLDGARTAPAQVRVLKSEPTHTWLQVIMREGKKRQIRRVAAILGHPATALVRIRIGPVYLGNLATGKWRELSRKEIEALRAHAEAGAVRVHRKTRPTQ
jgi:23S rRNA pseudouridine2605 synthase